MKPGAPSLQSSRLLDQVLERVQSNHYRLKNVDNLSLLNSLLHSLECDAVRWHAPPSRDGCSRYQAHSVGAHQGRGGWSFGTNGRKAQSPNRCQFGFALLLTAAFTSCSAASRCNSHAPPPPPCQCFRPAWGVGEWFCRCPPRLRPSRWPRPLHQSCRLRGADHAAAQDLAVASASMAAF
jgi:hypothetical protein